ncbi:hypothetical protein CIB84_016211, partial [Bambusicola thoracicus]
GWKVPFSLAADVYIPPHTTLPQDSRAETGSLTHTKLRQNFGRNKHRSPDPRCLILLWIVISFSYVWALKHQQKITML